MNLNKSSRVSLGLFVSLAVLSGSVTAATGSTTPASQKVEFKVSGQVSRALTFADNGSQSDTLFVDNTNSGSRLRVVGKVDISDSLSAGINIETQFEDNKSYSLDIGDTDNNNVFTSRKRDLWFKGGWGKLSLGKGDGAANNTSEIDHSGTWIANNSGDFLHSGLSFVDSTGTKTIKMKQAFSNFDGLSRNNRIRYDTPKFGPVGLAVSKKQNANEFALIYSQPMGNGSKLSGALGYVKENAADFKQLGLSASYLTSGGLSLTGHYGKKNLSGTTDPSGYYLKLGQKLGSAKNHLLSVGYHKVKDLNLAGDTAKRYNLSYVYLIPNRGIEIFADIQKAELSRTSGNMKDLNTVSIGSRIKF